MGIKYDKPETFWAYLAGFIDGEGHISLYPAKNKACHSGYAWRYTVCLTNTSGDLIKSIQADLGLGQILKKLYKNPKHNPLYRVDFTRKDLDIILPRVMPYLRDKKERATLLLEAFKHLQTGVRTEENDKALWEILAKMPKLRQIKK